MHLLVALPHATRQRAVELEVYPVVGEVRLMQCNYEFSLQELCDRSGQHECPTCSQEHL